MSSVNAVYPIADRFANNDHTLIFREYFLFTDYRIMRRSWARVIHDITAIFADAASTPPSANLYAC